MSHEKLYVLFESGEGVVCKRRRVQVDPRDLERSSQMSDKRLVSYRGTLRVEVPKWSSSIRFSYR